MHTYTYAHKLKHTHIHKIIHTHRPMDIHTSTKSYTYTHAHILTHTHKLKHTHTHACLHTKLLFHPQSLWGSWVVSAPQRCDPKEDGLVYPRLPTSVFFSYFTDLIQAPATVLWHRGYSPVQGEATDAWKSQREIKTINGDDRYLVATYETISWITLLNVTKPRLPNLRHVGLHLDWSNSGERFFGNFRKRILFRDRLGEFEPEETKPNLT